MMFGISTRSLPRLRSYEACKAYFDRTDKPRGNSWDDNDRPLDSARQQHKRIVRKAFSYQLYLYSTPMVTYDQNGGVEIIPHGSQSSSRFLDCFLPAGIDTVRQGRDTLMLQVVTADDVLYVTPQLDSIRCMPSDSGEPGTWRVVSEPKQRKRLVTDLKRAARLRKQAEPFLNWARATERLLQRRFNTRTIPTDNFVDPAKLEAALADSEHWPKLAEHAFVSPDQFMDLLYTKLEARQIVPIPNNLPPKRHKSPQHWALS